MTRETLTAATEHTGDQGVLERIRDAAIEQFGQHGFDTKFQAVAEAAGVSPALAIHQFGSKESLRKACDDYIPESIRTTKSEALQSMSPASWFARLGPNRVARANHGLPRAQHAVRR